MSWKFWCKWCPRECPKAPTVRDWEEITEFRDLPVRVLISWSQQEKGSFIIFVNTDEEVDYKTTGE
jgi:hypothetical protein